MGDRKIYSKARKEGSTRSIEKARTYRGQKAPGAESPWKGQKIINEASDIGEGFMERKKGAFVPPGTDKSVLVKRKGRMGLNSFNLFQSEYGQALN